MVPDKAGPDSARAARLLLKAIRRLPERERRTLLAHLLGRALEPAETQPRGVFGPSFMTREFVQEVGHVAAGMMRSGEGVAGVAALYGIPEPAVRAAVHEATSHPEASQPLAAIVASLAQGRSEAQTARDLGISSENVRRALDGLPSSPLEGRLGKALLAHTRLRARAPYAFTAPELPRGALALAASQVHRGGIERRERTPAPVWSAEGLAAGLGRMLLAGSDVAQVAAAYDLPPESIRATLREMADHSDTSEPLASILRLIADERDRAQIAEELAISEQEVRAALEELLPSPLARRLSHTLQASAAVSSAEPPATPSFAPGTTFTPALGGGEQQMVPVRFPEPQYRRLKEWCGRHGFSMAVVVRGLVERFLDDQERRAA